jgi:nucleotide-binding universal stress UspA family protein
MIKDILVKLERHAGHDQARDYAISLAGSLGAHLAGLAFAHASIPGFILPDIPSDVLADMMAESETEARQAVARFEAAADKAGIAREHRLVKQTEAGPHEVLAAAARRADLSVLLQSDHDNGVHNDLAIEAALFSSGRPVVVVPYIQRAPAALKQVICCWDGSATAARAINDALPLLTRAQAVELFIVASEKTRGEKELRGADMAQHLARHGVKVTVEVTPAADIDVASVILSHVADVGADLLVMGGYGHSRLREFMLGGVTQAILKSMTCPVLMAH